jgi:hypothetical protein
VKEAETSNSLLLLPDLRWPAQIDDQAGRMLEEKQVIFFIMSSVSNRTGKWLFIICFHIWDHHSIKDFVLIITVMKVVCSFMRVKYLSTLLYAKILH